MLAISAHSRVTAVIWIVKFEFSLTLSTPTLLLDAFILWTGSSESYVSSSRVRLGASIFLISCYAVLTPVCISSGAWFELLRLRLHSQFH